MVRLPDRPDDPPRRAQKRAGPGIRHPRLDRELESAPAAIHLDQDRRRDPGLTGKIYRTNLRRGTLVPYQATSARSTRRKLGVSWGANMLWHPATVPDGPGLLAQVTGSLSDR